ncbi:hypothetical protein GCM10010964_18880 [Caldovatus sediminis]|uniref:YjiS-like domain-containing protein n=1 Tax=Caldovatus sediminis TaxID=2041189 RepID=A0A8J2ZBM6_9PROT|nr:DUF1127 domain-containing protein [Caldovatus sediminis]GGG31157.1 hypothetical protein GCM10010964_18880 [Caldovatus sediminis]
MHIGRRDIAPSCDLERCSRGAGAASAVPATPAGRPSCRPLGGRFASLLRLPATLFLRWRRRMTEAHELAALSDRELRDIGLNRYEVARTLGRPFRSPW